MFNIKVFLQKFRTLLIEIKHLINSHLNYYQYLIKNILQNLIFYITISLCLLAFSYKYDTSYILLLFSLFCVSNLGYFIHWLSHKISFTKIYKSNNNLITNNIFINPFITKFCNFLDFHHYVHHNTSVNKKPINIFIEFIGNIFTQGLFFIFIQWVIKKIDFRICILWSFAYATVHNINYNILHPKQHQQHHIDVSTNYGIDLLDIMYGTKYDNSIEDYNHMSINFIIITCLIIYFT